MSRSVRPVVWCVLALALARPAWAQTATVARDARLSVTVTDPTGGVLPGAVVTLNGMDDASRMPQPRSSRANERGLATFDDLLPGRYAIRIDMDGFDSALVTDLRVNRGENRRTQVMAVKRLDETVTVQRDKQSVATDRTLVFGSTLTREQIEALPDDPAELEKALRELAGGDAIFRVDSFEGGRLPDKSMIKAIHISRDQFAAENHWAEGITIDIVTQAGAGPFRLGSNYNLRDSALDGKNPLIGAKGPTRNQNLGLNVGGTLIPNKLSMSARIGYRNSFNTPLLYAQTPDGLVSQQAGIRSPATGVNIYGDVTYALTKDQTLRVYYNEDHSESKNLGVGGYSFLDRAYGTRQTSRQLRGQEAGPLGRRFVTNTKFMVNWQDSQSTSTSDALTQIVNDAFTIGGAQRRGGRTTLEYMVQSDLDYVRGMHTVRTGILVNGGSYRSDDETNYTGTYVFDSLAAYQAGRPRSFTRRIGDPLIEYSNTQVGIYVQDDIRLRKNLSISPGLRYEVQTHLRDRGAIAPRFGFTWSPGTSGTTSIRGSVGIFYEWFAANVYEQSLRIDGFRQRELSIANPAYPNAGSIGIVSATNRYLVDPALKMPRNLRFSGGIDHAFTPRLRLGVSYTYLRQERMLRGENLNAPAGGVRPDAVFANVIRTVSDGEGRAHGVSVFGSWQFAQMTPALQAKKFDVRRGGLNLNYSVNRVRNNFDGPFAAPASGTLDSEWGRSGGDAPYRLGFGINSSALRNLNVSINVNAASGPVYNITTGRDDNGDLVFNDRPAGTARNAARGTGMWTVNGNIAYGFTFGKRAGSGTTALPPGIAMPAGMMVMAAREGAVMIGGGPAGGAGSAPGRYRVSIFISAQNLTNHANPMGWSGVMTSPLFGKSTAVQGVRQINMGINFGF
jgi:hypothetical protein